MAGQEGRLYGHSGHRERLMARLSYGAAACAALDRAMAANPGVVALG